MAGIVTFSELREVLRSGNVRGHEFNVLRSIARMANSSDPESNDQARELLIRVLERRPEFSEYEALVGDLTRHLGLLPYMPEPSTISEALVRELYRPQGLPSVVLHAEQFEVYRKLIDGESVVLSAPTSFGKSLLIDAVIAARRFQNVAIVVPTLALMDETRRRLTITFPSYKVHTHANQALKERNIYVMTQERLLSLPQVPKLDFFVIDEFYKIDPAREPEGARERAYLLNTAWS